MKEWYSKQMDFVLGYPYAHAEVPLHMNFPKGYKFKEGITTKTHVLELIKNLYGQKQAGRVWNQYLHEGFSKIGFVPSKLEPCLYYRENVTLLVYIDNCIMFSPTKKELEKVVKEMRNSPKKFRVEDLGDVKDFLGIQVIKHKGGSIELTQPQLIESILKDLNFQANIKMKETPAWSTVIVFKYLCCFQNKFLAELVVMHPVPSGAG